MKKPQEIVYLRHKAAGTNLSMNKNLKISYFEQINIRVPFSRTITGLLLGLAYAFAFYALLYVAREAFRVLSVTEFYDMWVLTDQEVRFFNLFFAYLALLLGTSIAFQYIFERPKRMFEKQYRRKISILHDQRFMNWYFLSFFSKTALAFGLMFGVGFPHFYNAHYVIDFYPDYIYLFVLIIIVLYLQMWVNIRQTFRRKSLKWMFLSFLIISALAWGMSRIDIIDYRKLNQTYLSHNVFEKYHLQLPEVDYSHRIYKSGLGKKVFLVKNPENSNDLPILVLDDYITTDLKEVALFVLRFEQSMREAEKPLLFTHLFIDKNIKMKYVNRLKKELIKVNSLKAAFAVIPASAEYDKRFYKNRVISFKLDWHLVDFNTLKYFEPYKNIIQIKTGSGKTYINGKPVADKRIKEHLNKLIENNPADYSIYFHIDDDMPYENYIKIRADAQGAVKELRDTYARKVYQKPYDYLNWENQKKIKKKFPLHIFEITPEVEEYLQKHPIK